MANVFAIHSVCQSIAAYLQGSYPASVAELPMPPCSFEVLSSSQLAGPLDDASRIGIYLYRTSPVEGGPMRLPPTLEPGGGARRALLQLNLHFLVFPCSRSAQDEQVTLAWTLRQLHLHPILDMATLTAEAAWAADEVVQVTPDTLPMQDMLHIWRALGAPYRLSAAYTARAVRLHADARAEPLPVVVPVLGPR